MTQYIQNEAQNETVKLLPGKQRNAFYNGKSLLLTPK